MIGWEGNYSADPPPPFPLTQASYFTVLSKWRPNFKKRRSLVSVQINFQKCSYVWFQLLKSVNNTITLRLIHPNHQKKSFGKKFKSVLSMSQNSVIILFYYIFMIVQSGIARMKMGVAFCFPSRFLSHDYIQNSYFCKASLQQCKFPMCYTNTIKLNFIIIYNS